MSLNNTASQEVPVLYREILEYLPRCFLCQYVQQSRSYINRLSVYFSLGSKDMLPLAVLQKLMGPSASIKYSSNVTSSKAMIAAGKATSSPYMVGAQLAIVRF